MQGTTFTTTFLNILFQSFKILFQFFKISFQFFKCANSFSFQGPVTGPTKALVEALLIKFGGFCLGGFCHIRIFPWGILSLGDFFMGDFVAGDFFMGDFVVDSLLTRPNLNHSHNLKLNLIWLLHEIYILFNYLRK